MEAEAAARRTRSVIMFLGPLLHRAETFDLPYAGGCNLGERTVEPHMSALRPFGLEVKATEGSYHASVDRAVEPVRPIVLTERGDTVTENALMAAALHPGTTVVLVLVLDAAAALLATVFYGVLPLVALGLCAGLAQSLAKFCLDATIQSDVPTKVQASAFARSDTTLQLAWVVGGFVGIALPLDPPRLGLGVAFAVLAAWMFFVLAGRSRRYPGEVPVTG